MSATLSRRAFTIAALTSAMPLIGSDKPRILVHGHRGARARRPENTLPAFRYAIEQGVRRARTRRRRHEG